MRVHLAALAAATILPFAASPAEAAATVVYECTTTATSEKQEVSLDVELTVPAQATVDQQLTIGWSGAFVTGKELVAPATGMEGELKMYVYAGISGIDDLTSATGVADLGMVIPGEPVAIPPTATMTTTPRKPGSGTVHAASINFGLTPQDRLVECVVKGSATEYPLTVTGADGSTPSDSTTPTGSTTPTDSTTPEDDGSDGNEPDSTPTTTSSDIPSGGVDTGAGGMAGPDGRALMLTGLVVMLAAIVGLRLRRPRSRA